MPLSSGAKKKKNPLIRQIPPRTAVLENLENYIRANPLSPDSRLPSERDLCLMWGCSRTTLRGAVNLMVKNGQLYKKRGSGAYVTRAKITRNLHGVDTLVSDIRQANIPLVTKVLSLRTISCTKQICRNLHIPLGQKVYEMIRLRSIGGIPSIIETTYIDTAQCPGFDTYDLERGSMYSIFINIYKKEGAGGYENISVTYTTKEEASLLSVQAGTPVFFVSGVTTMADGIPLEYYKALFRADRFKFVCANRSIGD